MQRYIITHRIHFFGRMQRSSPRSLDLFIGHERVESIHYYSEAFVNTSHVLSHVSVSMYTDFLSFQFMPGFTVIEITSQINSHTEYQFSHSIRVLSRSIHSHYAMIGTSLQVDIIITGSGTYNYFQFFSSIDHFFCRFIRTDDHSIYVGNSSDQFFRRSIFFQ